MKKKASLFLFPSLFLLFFFQCCESPFSENSGKVIVLDDIIEGTGTIKYLDFEGGFYGIIADNDKHYDPINLPKEFEVNGLRVYFKAKIRKDLGSYHLWGAVIELIYIKKL